MLRDWEDLDWERLNVFKSCFLFLCSVLMSNLPAFYLSQEHD